MEGMRHCIVQHGDFTVNHSCCQQGAHGNAAFHEPPVVNAMASSSHHGGGTGGCRISLGSNNDVPFDNWNLKKQHVKHDDVAHCLAPHLASSVDCEIKSCICEDMVAAICDGGKEDWWRGKTLFLCNCI